MASRQVELPHQGGHEHPRLRVYLLGSPQVKWDDQVLNIPRRQVRALLYYLAAHMQRTPYEFLHFLLWPNRSDATARRYLSHLLTHLRRAVPGPSPLITTVDHVKLDPRLVWSDSQTFRQLITRDELEEDEEHVERAVELYRGPFLHGFSLGKNKGYEEWAEQEGYLLEHLLLRALSSLIDACTVKQEYENAILYAQRYLQVDGLAEQIHLRLIRLYGLAGKRGMAIEQFRRCVKILGDELGVLPIPEIQESYQEAVRAGMAKAPLTAGARLPASRAAPQKPMPVQNRHALDQLMRVFGQVSQGAGQVVTISGEAGIGKSHVMREFAQRVSGEAKILGVTCQAHTQMVPYYALRQALGAAEEPDGVPGGLIGAQVLDAGSSGPDWPQRASPAPDPGTLPLTEVTDRLTLQLASNPKPVLLAFEDVEWADNASLNWLVQLGQQLHGTRILVLLSYCCTAVGAVADFRHRLTEGGGLGYEIHLAGLDIEGILQLVHQAAGRFEGDRSLAESLARLTGGNPALALELLKALAESGSGAPNLMGEKGVPLPFSLHAAILTRVERLSPVARRVIEAASFLETPFDFRQVCLVAGLPEMEAVDALDELVSRQLLADEYPLYRFCHGLVPDIMQADMSPIRREILSRRAASCVSGPPL